MKVVRFFGFMLLGICLLSSPSCKEDPVINIPVSQKLIGLWKQTEAREEGFVITLDPYMTLEFFADKTAVVRVFDGSDDTEIDSTNDMYELTNSDTMINFDVETDLEIVEITETQLIVKYQGTNQIGQSVERQDTYAKQ